MRRANNLFSQVISFENLLLAAKKAMWGKKAKNSVRNFYFNLENEIIELKSQLENKTYKPRPYSQFLIYEPKQRLICSSDFRDRVIHHAICNIAEPFFEKRSIVHSYACRLDKGSHKAVAYCQNFSRKSDYYLKCDIKKFFESIDHEVLKKILRKLFKDNDLLWLLDLIIDHQVIGSASRKGLPIGNLTSQHFANLYLGELDHFIKDKLGIKGYVRYMDDFICFGSSKKELWDLHDHINQFVEENLFIKLKETVTQVAPVTEGIPFLGFRVYPQIIRLKRENLNRFRKKINRKEQLYRENKLKEIDLIRSVNSMISHVQYVNSLALRRSFFIDSLNLV